MLCIIVNYFLGFKVVPLKNKKAKFYLTLSIILNVGLLVFFKYCNFFIQELNNLFAFSNSTLNLPILHIVLPIGISFYTFHGISYIIDVYRGKIPAEKNIVNYALFVSFFPLLVAGPIERAEHLIPQIKSDKKFNYQQSVEGIYLIILGLFKKIVIADSLAIIVDNTYQDFQSYTALSLIIAAISYSFQIYCDFSGYSDIAVGSSKLLGFEILSNFKFPYFAKNIPEFYRKWHISLSSWFRDYLYIPLGGSKNGRLKTTRNVYLIFMLSGLWHGTNWTYIFRGFLNACLYLKVVLFKKNTSISTSNSKIKSALQILNTFTLVTILYVFFRSTSITNAFLYFKSIIANIYDCPEKLYNGVGLTNLHAFIYIIPILFIDWKLRKDDRKVDTPFFKKISYFLIILILFKIISTEETQYIYYNF
jgi:D-alanyl-lipoteichoic acid acyltransferase DltB (MBOAT superfamily)